MDLTERLEQFYLWTLWYLIPCWLGHLIYRFTGYIPAFELNHEHTYIYRFFWYTKPD